MLARPFHYLVALATERHFARAAERCNISQPALSLAIKQLEIDLGVPIVQRGNRFCGLTQEGEIVLRWAQRMLSDEESLKQELSLYSGLLAGRLRLGVIPSATAIAARLTTAFVADHPTVPVFDLEMSSIGILHALAAFEIDGGITYLDNEPLEHVRSLPIQTEEYVLVTPHDSPVGGLRAVTWKAAAALPLCLLERSMQNRRIIESIFASVGVRPNAVSETNSMMSKYCHLRLGYWSSIMPKSFMASLPPPENMRVIPLVEPSVTKTIGLVVADRDPIPPVLRAFWHHAELHAAPAVSRLAALMAPSKMLN